LPVNENDWLQLVTYFALLTALTPVFGGWMQRIYSGEKHLLSRPLGWLENWIYRLAGCRPDAESTPREYAAALLWFNALGLVVLLALQLFQGLLPFNPQKMPAVPFGLALNTAMSFMTNTNWQAYSGEAVMSYFTQMAGLTVQNFLSAATGMAVLVALTRGLARRSSTPIGNFWVDLVRSTVYILLPLSVLLAVVLVHQGVVQTFSPYVEATSLEGGVHLIPLGPAASQIAIKQLGTNGGGFFGVNSAHPFENPTPLSNFLQMLAILLIPAAMVDMYGRMVGSRKHGWAIYGAMLALLLGTLALGLYGEYQSNPALAGLPNLEGKETRFGILNSVLWGGVTTAASNGSVNAMHDSFSPFGGLMALFNLMLGEVVFGGVGAGLYGMIMYIIITVFIAGLMVGRTPEYLGKKIEKFEIIMAMIATLVPFVVLLLFSAIAVLVSPGLSSLNNQGPHGLSEILYAFASMVGNNGSAFAGLNANTDFYNYLGAIAIFVGRFAVILPALAIAWSMGHKKISPPSAGTFPTDGPLFAVLLMAVVVIVAGLTHLPALTLGPIAEHFLMLDGRTF
jgi:K+-transporting ATPase ATPase A chain